MKKLAGIWLLSAGVASACGVGELRRVEELTASVEEVHGSRVLTLSHSLMDVAAGVVKASLLRSDLRIGGADSVWFGSVADVAVMSGGRFAVFDRLEKQIVLSIWTRPVRSWRRAGHRSPGIGIGHATGFR